MSTKRWERLDLEEFRSLFEKAALALEEEFSGEYPLVIECMQTAEFIVGYYLMPYYPAPALIELPDLGALFAWIVQAQEFLPLSEKAKQAVDALIKQQEVK